VLLLWRPASIVHQAGCVVLVLLHDALRVMLMSWRQGTDAVTLYQGRDVTVRAQVALRGAWHAHTSSGKSVGHVHRRPSPSGAGSHEH